MTTELHDDLINFSFNDLYDVFKNNQTHEPDSYLTIFDFVLPFLKCLKELVRHHDSSSPVLCIPVFTHFMIQPSSEANHIGQTLQARFDRMLCNVLERCYLFPGFTLFLGSLFQYTTTQLQLAIAGFLQVLRHWGKQYILDGIRFAEIGWDPQYFVYFTKLLESPEKSGTHIFNQQRYVTAAKECLQLYLCSHRKFSKGATEFACHDKALRRSKPWEWVARLGVHSRIREAKHHFKVLRHQSIEVQAVSYQDDSFSENSPNYLYYECLSYRWALYLLPFLLEKSAVSLELADVLRGCTFAMMAWEFLRRIWLAKEAIARYLLRVESAAGGA